MKKSPSPRKQPTQTKITVTKSRIFSKSVLPKIPDFYEDKPFDCKDCGSKEIWTARQQQRWYELQGGEIEAIAIRCKKCRHKEKIRRAATHKAHLDGITKTAKNTPPQI